MALNIIVTRVNDCDFKVDRTSVLGNPFKMFREQDRDKVCDEFAIYFEQQLLLNNKMIIDELKRIKQLASNKPYFKIGCHCAPKRCHGDTIAYFLNNYSDSL